MGTRRVRVSVRRWRWQRSYNAVLVSVAVLAGLGLAAWRAIDPPRSVVREVPVESARDLPGEDFARRFVSAWLSYDAQDPRARARGLAPFGGPGQPGALGFDPPSSGSRTVLGASVVQVFALPGGRERIVVGADTDRDGRVYVSVTVARHPDGALGLVGYPAIVGAPSTGGLITDAGGARVQDAALAAVVRRALGNYLAGAEENLSADLAADAVVSLPGTRLTLSGVLELVWSRPGDSVLATVQARDGRGGQLTLSYQLGVLNRGRWFVRGIHTDPTAR